MNHYELSYSVEVAYWASARIYKLSDVLNEIKSIEYDKVRAPHKCVNNAWLVGLMLGKRKVAAFFFKDEETAASFAKVANSKIGNKYSNDTDLTELEVMYLERGTHEHFESLITDGSLDHCYYSESLDAYVPNETKHAWMALAATYLWKGYKLGVESDGFS